ncbi:MAG: FAD-binding oxidoreductase [Mariprofundaceae bacterium]|nr:FAD-binding oxidoreductase [Mariprofundaceae bacterium]
MKLTQCSRLSDPACDDVIVKISLERLNGQAIPHFIAGQYVRVDMPFMKEPAPAYFAIASSPYHQDSYEFVIKSAQGMSEYLVNLPLGSEVEVEGPIGKGFDLSHYKDYNVILLSVGTGIAPLRSLWGKIIQERQDYAKVSIYAGFLTALHTLLTDEMNELSHHDIDVSLSLTTGHENWEGAVGYVQHALAEDAPSAENTVVCLAGMSAMVDACTETLHNLGFHDDQILLNF